MRTRSSGTAEVALPFSNFSCIAVEVQKELSLALGNSECFRDQYLLDNFLSKYPGGDALPADAREAAAYASTLADEEHNKRTNARLSSINHVFPWFSASAVFLTASHLIADTLGDFSVDVYSSGSFTSGAAVGFPKRASSVDKKYRKRVTCTVNAVPRVLALIMATPPWRTWLESQYGEDPMQWVNIVDGSVGFTVPKNAKTDRFCCKEPSGNMQLQKGIGNHIRQCLRRVGINLNDQSRNRHAARRGSITGELATLDLKSASNSVTLALVFQLLSSEWFSALMSCRSPGCQIDPSDVDSYRKFEMVSSMGNGFTFELESLIFWALCEAVRRLSACPGRVLVYGDDIVVPTTIAHRVIAVLNYSGFRINPDKSFWTGNFRESCGGHYINGTDVTPIICKDLINDTSRVLWLLNSLRKWGNIGGIVDDRLWPLYRKMQRRYIDPRLWGGKRLVSVTSLATPHPPRQALGYHVVRFRTNGYPGLLRSFQYRHRPEMGADGSAGCHQDAESSTQRETPTSLFLKTTAGHYLEREAAMQYELTRSLGLETPQQLYDLVGQVAVTKGLAFLCKISERPTKLRLNEEPYPDAVPCFCAEL